MNIKTILIVVAIAVTGVVLWRSNSRSGEALRAVAENVSMAVEESVLPEEGNPDKAAVIRKAMIEQRKKENSEWTAANIKARPDLYLEHCRKMLEKFHGQYEVAIIETQTEINVTERRIRRAEESSRAMTGFLKVAQKALSDSSFCYPGKIGVYMYEDADQVKKAVVKTDEKLTEQEQVVTAGKANVIVLKETLSQLKKGKSRVARELQGFNVKVGQVKADAVRKSTDQIRDRIDALLSGVDALPEVDDPATNAGTIEDAEVTAEDVFKRRKIN